MATCALRAEDGQAPNDPKGIPLTTSSEAARRAFQGGLENIENQQTPGAFGFRGRPSARTPTLRWHIFSSPTTTPTLPKKKLNWTKLKAWWPMPRSPSNCW